MDPEVIKKEYARREAKAQEQQEVALREAEAERGQLLAKQGERQTAEALASMTAEERAEYDRVNDPKANIQRLAEQARAQAEAKFDADNVAQHQKELSEWKANHPRASNWEKFNAEQEITQRAAKREKDYLQARADRELQAGKHDSYSDFVVATLDENERAIFSQELDKWTARNPLSGIQEIQQTSAQRANEQKQAALQKQYDAEARSMRGKPGQIIMLKEKYRKIGLNIY